MKLYKDLLEEFKNGQMGYAAFAIIGQSCIGSVAAMMILMSDLSQVTLLLLLFLVTVLCMAFNGAVLAQLKPKITFNLLVLSVMFSGIVIAIFLI
jgi:hypothetical protein